MTLLEKLEQGMAARRAELINQPLARIWGDLAKVAEEVCNKHATERLRDGVMNGMCTVNFAREFYGLPPIAILDTKVAELMR